MANADNVSVWTTVPVAVRDQLEAIAEKEERSISYIVRRILTRHLDTINAGQIGELAKAMTSSPQLKLSPSETPTSPLPQPLKKRPRTALKTKSAKLRRR